MINNDSERIFQDSNFLADSDFTYLFDFSERDGEQSEMNVFFGGNVTETFAPVINAGTSFCEPSTDHDMFDGWQKSDDCLAMQTTFDISSSTTSASHSTATQLNACQPGQYSKPLFQHVQAASGTTENKRRKIDDDSLHREASDSFANLRHPPHKYHTVKHSRKILGETESEERGTPEKQSSSDLGKMLSTYPAAGSGSAGRRLPSPVSTSIHGSMQQLESISVYALKCLTKYGFCALDNFMGQEAGSRALSEVMKIESQGLFEDGRLVTQERNSQSVRGDKIFWIDSDTYPAISRLISRMDLIVFKLQKSFPERSISSRTKPMVACYPGLGAAYRRHVDNSNQDGRLITCLYYLNKDWDLLVRFCCQQTTIGLLRSFLRLSGYQHDIHKNNNNDNNNIKSCFCTLLRPPL